MYYVSRFTFHASRFISQLRQLQLDLLTGSLLFLAGLYGYSSTLAPTVLDGDAALFQYTPYVLGVTYPTGYPLYILLGKVWVTLFPFGELAWRMNLFSAVCAAGALPLIYGAAQRLFTPPQSPPLGGEEKRKEPPSLGREEKEKEYPSPRWEEKEKEFSSPGGEERGKEFPSPRGEEKGEKFLPSEREGRRGQWPARWAALVTVLTFATLPTFWRWSTETKIYALNILLFSGILYTLALALETKVSRFTFHVSEPTKWPAEAKASYGRITFHVSEPTKWPAEAKAPYGRITFHLPALALTALLLGLQLSVHSTTALLIPGLVLFAWLHFRQQVLSKKLFGLCLSLLIIPGLLYFYIPLRAEWLIAQYGRAEAIGRGLLADFYHSGLTGWIRYFSAADFTGGVVTNWGLVPQQFFTVYVPLLLDDLTRLGAVLGAMGGLALAFMRPRLFWPLFLLYAMPIPFVLTYGQGEQSAFLLPSFLIFSIFIGYTVILINQLVTTLIKSLNSHPTPHVLRFRAKGPLWAFYVLRFTPLFLFLILFPILFLPRIAYNVNWLNAKWDRANYNYWSDALAHPLEPGAAMLAQWGDLTSFWYMQHAEGRRPDLRGLYPPAEAMVTNYLQSGGDLYIAGPSSKDWVAGIEEHYQLLPWGRLVRIAPRQVEPESLLPALPHSVEATFDNKLRLIGVDYPSQAVDGQPYGVTLTWQALAELPPETTISLRLSQGETIAAQLDDALLSGWFPSSTLSAGQHVLSYVPIQIPLGTLPGRYRLQLVAYISYKHPWPMADGTTLLDLGEVELVLPPVDERLDANPFRTWPGYDFNNEIELADYEYSASRVGQGKGFAVRLLWRAKTKPADNYTLLAEAVDATGQVLRSVQQQPAGGRAPTAGWQAGQFVRDQVDFVLPASAPVGEQALWVRLSWVRPNGSKLNVRRWWLPVGERLTLAGLAVVEKEDRVFSAPPIQYPVGANLDNKARFLGYNSPSLQTGAGESGAVQFDRAVCEASAEACKIHFDFYWQGLNEMDQLYFVFLHVVDTQGQIVAQHDLGPGTRGKQPTTSWLPNEVVLDPVDLSLSPTISPGRYPMRLGMYLPPAGPRLPVLDEQGQIAGDSVEIGAIQVRP